MKNKLERLISDISKNTKTINALGRVYSTKDDRIEKLADLGEQMMCLPEYYQTKWLEGLDNATLDIVHRYFLLMEIYIEKAKCRGIFINNPLNISEDLSRVVRVETAKKYLSVHLGNDNIDQLTIEVMKSLNRSIDNGQSKDSYTFAALMFNHYYSFVKRSTDQMGWSQMRGDLVMKAYEHAENLKDHLKQILGEENGRKKLVSNLGTFRL